MLVYFSVHRLLVNTNSHYIISCDTFVPGSNACHFSVYASTQQRLGAAKKELDQQIQKYYKDEQVKYNVEGDPGRFTSRLRSELRGLDNELIEITLGMLSQCIIVVKKSQD